MHTVPNLNYIGIKHTPKRLSKMELFNTETLKHGIGTQWQPEPDYDAKRPRPDFNEKSQLPDAAIRNFLYATPQDSVDIVALCNSIDDNLCDDIDRALYGTTAAVAASAASAVAASADDAAAADDDATAASAANDDDTEELNDLEGNETFEEEKEWFTKLHMVHDYLRMHGCLPSLDDTLNDVYIGNWLYRQQHQLGALNSTRKHFIKTLPNEGNCMKTSDEAWEYHLGLLREYITVYGKQPSTNTNTIYKEIKLGIWVAVQRRVESGTSYGVMTPERKAKLETVPGWRWTVKPNDMWNKNYQLLIQYIQEFGHPPSQGNNGLYKGVLLSSWVSIQRRALRGNIRYNLNANRIHLLENLPGWKWESDSDKTWTFQYNNLVSFVKQFGRFPDQTDDDKGDKNRIGHWTRRQRLARHIKIYGKLNALRIQTLESIPGWCW